MWDASSFRRETFQCSGIWSSQGMPESLRRTLGSRPRVTARWMMACFCSFSSAMIFLFVRNRPVYPPVHVVQKANDGGIARRGRHELRARGSGAFREQ